MAKCHYPTGTRIRLFVNSEEVYYGFLVGIVDGNLTMYKGWSVFEADEEKDHRFLHSAAAFSKRKDNFSRRFYITDEYFSRTVGGVRCEVISLPYGNINIDELI